MLAYNKIYNTTSFIILLINTKLHCYTIDIIMVRMSIIWSKCTTSPTFTSTKLCAVPAPKETMPLVALTAFYHPFSVQSAANEGPRQKERSAVSRPRWTINFSSVVIQFFVCSFLLIMTFDLKAQPASISFAICGLCRIVSVFFFNLIKMKVKVKVKDK